MPYVPPFGTGDALCAQTLSDLKVFTDWLSANGQSGKGIITEVGIPGSCLAGTDPNTNQALYDPGWENVLQQWYEGANRANLHVTTWLASEWGLDLRVYRTDDGNNKPLNYRTTVSSVVENNLSGANGVTAFRGVAYGGGDYSDQGGSGIVNRSHVSQPAAGYYYPAAGSMPVLAARLGAGALLRIPVRWERLQPTLKGALDAAEMVLLDVTINAAVAAGLKPILDIHNYGRYDATPLGNPGDTIYILGQNAPATHNGATVGGTMISCFTDLWTKIMQHYNSGQLWGAELMNEPHDFPNGVSDWQAASQAAVEAIRMVSQSVYIVVDGYSYATVPNWTSTNGTSAWLTETIPGGQTGAGTARNNDAKILWCGHHYFNNTSWGHDGSYRDTYAADLTSATNRGFVAYATGGYVAPATNNTLQTGLRTTFTTSFDSVGDFGDTYSGIQAGSNTVTLPFSGVGNPGNSMKIIGTATSDEGSVRKDLTGGRNSRIIQFDFQLDAASTISATSNYCIAHMWNNSFANDLAEIRIIGSGAGYIMQVNTTGTGYPTVTGTTVLAKGLFQNIKFEVTDTNFNIYLNGSGTPELSMTGQSNSGQNVGGIALGKFYGNQPLTMYFDNFTSGIMVTAYAPPNGGKLTPAVVLPSSNTRGLIGFI